MSQENVEIVRRAIAAGTSEPPDVDTLQAVLDPEHVLLTDWGVEQGRHLGVEGFLAAVADAEAAWDSLTQEVEGVLDAGERGVVVLMRAKARGKESGADVENPWAMLVVLRGGRITSSRAFLHQGAALKAAGLEASRQSRGGGGVTSSAARKGGADHEGAGGCARARLGRAPELPGPPD